MENMVFKPASGSYITEEQAQKYGERLMQLENENNGCLSAESVVDDAKYPSSPLHDYFNWDDTEAAKKWRAHQARLMISHIYIVIEEQEVRAFQNLTFKVEGSEATTAYITTIRALSEPELRQQMIEKALGELNNWRKRYKQYKELGNVFAAIERAEEQLKLVVPA